MIVFDKEKFREKMISLRLIKNRYSMDQLGGKIGVSKATISRLERGGDIDMNTFCRCVSALGLDPNEFFKIIK